MEHRECAAVFRNAIYEYSYHMSQRDETLLGSN